MNKQLSMFDIEEGERKRDEGIATAIDHADHVEEDWSVKAYRLLIVYAKQNEEFMAEDARFWSLSVGLSPPPDNRAYGGVVRRAALAGLLTSVGAGKVKNPSHHRGFGTVWKSNIYVCPPSHR